MLITAQSALAGHELAVVMRRAGKLAVAIAVMVTQLAAVPHAAARGLSCRSLSADAALPDWARQRHVTVLADSVLLSGEDGVRNVMPCRRVAFRGRPALMLRIAERELRAARQHVAPLVVVGLGHNSLWDRNRHRYRVWAARFDREAKRLVRTLRLLGARQIVWVTIREPRPEFLPPAGRAELGRYSWYFPYVNERLRVLDARYDDVALADWTAVSNRRGLTYDSIHLTAKGARLMGRTIKAAIHAEAERQALTTPP